MSDDTERLRVLREEWDNARAAVDRLDGFKKIRFAQIKDKKMGPSDKAKENAALLDQEWWEYMAGLLAAQEKERETRAKWVHLSNLREDRLNADANRRAEQRMTR